MCTVSISVNDAVIRRINPSLTSKEAISQWLQHQVDIMLDELADTVEEPPCVYNSKEEVIAEVQRRMEEIENGRAKMIPHEEVKGRIDNMLNSYAD